MKPCARPAIALTLAAGLLGAGGLSTAAAAAPVCNLVTDPAGDAKGDAGLVNEDILDVVSADVASDKKKITAVIRVKKLAATSANYPLGITWRLNFTIGDTSFGMAAISDRSGVIGQTSFTPEGAPSGTIGGPATAVLDLAKNEVRVTAPTSAFATRISIKPGMKLTEPGAVTGGILQFSTPVVTGNLRYANVDDTVAGAAYTAGSPSCVKPGK